MILNRKLRQISSYQFHYDMDIQNKEFWKFFTKNQELRGWTNINVMDGLDTLNALTDVEGGYFGGTLQEVLNNIAKQNYVLLGNLANGGDPNIDIICSHYVVYFRDDYDYFNGFENIHETADYAILIDDEINLIHE